MSTRTQLSALHRARPSDYRRWARRLVSGAYYAWQRRRPVDDHLAVYAAYWATSYACSPAAIHQEAGRLAPAIRSLWVVKPEYRDFVPAGVDAVAEGSRAYYRAVAHAKYLVNNVNFPDDVVKRPGTVHVQTHHGTPIKTMGMDLRRYPTAAAAMNFDRLMRRAARWDYVVSANRYSSDVWRRAFPGLDFEVLEVGLPRNDRLVRATPDDAAAVRAMLDLPAQAMVVLYAPTFRDWQREVFAPPVDLERLCAALPEGAVILVRGHYWTADRSRLQPLVRRGVVRDVSAHPVVEDLMLAADVLLTDYSSILFDYADLDRPIVVFADDWETYVHERGIYLDLMAEAPGVVETTQDGLIDAFRSGRYRDAEATARRAAFRQRYSALDDGHAAERVVRRVFLDQEF